MILNPAVITVKNTAPMFATGPIIFEESGTFKPSDYGLSVGDRIQVICIGSGAGGLGSDGGAAGEGDAAGDYGCGGNGTASYKSATDRYYGADGGGGSGYLVKAEIVITSDEPISVSVAGAAAKGEAGGATSFGTFLTAPGGSVGTTGTSSTSSTGYKNGVGGTGGHNARSVYHGGDGWTVKSYALTDSSGTLHKGSGAVFIWW